MRFKNTTDGSLEPVARVQVISWKMVETSVDQFVTESPQVRGYPFNRIVALGRGGLSPAVLLAHKLKITDFRVIISKSYEPGENAQQGIAKFIDPLTAGLLASEEIESLDDLHTLVVDDLCDSGNTFKALREFMPEATFMSLFHKNPEGTRYQQWKGYAMPRDMWLIFPWEVRDAGR